MLNDNILNIKTFVFSPFQENTYVLYDDKNYAVVVDPGMQNKQEEKEFSDFISNKQLILKRIVLTHAHIDHVFGLDYVVNKYQIPVALHKDSIGVLSSVPQYAGAYGYDFSVGDYQYELLNEGDEIEFGLKVLHVPGHAPGHLVFYQPKTNEAWVGDVLFYQSIGRTDLPGGDYQLLIDGIKKKILTLPPNVKAYSGHGQTTTIGFEKENNPFLR